MVFPNHPHPYAQAQELNEFAAELVEIGQYDKAITALTKALELWKRCSTEDDIVEVCMCPRCCNFKDDQSCEIQVDEKEIDSTTSIATMEDSKLRLPQDKNDYQEYPIGFEYGYFHTQMIRIPCRHKFDVYNVSSAVALIVIFNLAIVYHLSALELNNKLRMAKTLRLYELANDCLNTYVNDTNNNFRKGGGFEMGTLIQIILINNLSHLHSFMGNPLTSQHCTEKLIPILMCVVDDKIRNIEPRIFNDIGCVALEGFFQNISPLVLKSQCADAA